MKNTIIALATASFAIGSVNAQTITPSSVTTNLDLSGITNGAVSQIIDGSTASTNGIAAAFLSSPSGSNVEFDFALGGAFDLVGFQLSNDFGSGFPDGIRDFTLNFFNGGSFLSSYTGVGVVGAGGTTPVDNHTFSLVNNVDRVVLEVSSTHAGPSGGTFNNQLQFREVAFIGSISRVPEPSSALLLGLGAFGLLGRRKR